MFDLQPPRHISTLRFRAVRALVQPVGSVAPCIDDAALGKNTKRTDSANGGGLATSIKGDAQKLVIGKPGDRVPELVSKSLGRGTPGSCGAVDQGRSRNKC